MSTPDDRELRFDAELRRAARSLVTEELPRGILDPTLGNIRPRRVLPGLTPVAAAAAVLVVATALALNPGSFGGPGPSPTPTASPIPSAPAAALFRSTAAIRSDLATLGYTCQVGQPLSSIAPGPDAAVRESAVCLAPDSIGSFTAAVIVGETTAGVVVELHAKADIVGDDTPAARAAVAVALAKVAAIGAAIPSAGNELGAWVDATLPTIEPSAGANTFIAGFDIKIARNDNGGYVVIVHPAIG